MAYATESEVRALLGNLKAQVSTTTITNAVASADAQIDRMTSRSWTSGDADYNAIKKASRYLAAAECMVNIGGTEPTQQRLWDQAMLLLQNITKFDTSDLTGDYVSMSEPTTYPLNEQGSIWASSRFPNIKKSTVHENEQDGFNWVSGYP